MQLDDIFDDFERTFTTPMNFWLSNWNKDDQRLKNHKLKDYNPTISMDVSETKDKIKVKINLPGFEKKDISIELKDDAKYLIIKGENKEEEKEENEIFHIVQRSFGKFEKKVSLPQNKIDIQKIKADMKNGILSIEIQKIEPPKIEQKTIQID